MDKDLESVQEARSLLQSCARGVAKFEHFTEDQVERILLEISKVGIANAQPLAKMAVEETGYGTVEHKTLKNLFCADDVYRAIRPMKTVGIVNEDKEKKVFEVASPIGVIAAIIPSTNPTSTTIYKALIALKGRNAIVFSPHPIGPKMHQRNRATARRRCGTRRRAARRDLLHERSDDGRNAGVDEASADVAHSCDRRDRLGSRGVQRRQTRIRRRARQCSDLHRKDGRCCQSRERHPDREVLRQWHTVFIRTVDRLRRSRQGRRTRGTSKAGRLRLQCCRKRRNSSEPSKRRAGR